MVAYRNGRRLWLLLLVTLVALLVIFGCSDSKKEIVGKWALAENEWSVRYEFLKDGTVINYDPLLTLTGEYKLLDDNRMLMEFGGLGSLISGVYTFEISGDRLILDDEEFVRVE